MLPVMATSSIQLTERKKIMTSIFLFDAVKTTDMGSA